MRSIGVIQARMGSTRFPGKMLARLAGRPLLWHVISRMQQAATLDDVVVATTTDSRDDALALFAQKLDVRVVRGSEDDVLSRFVLAAHETSADVVVRINGDAPLVDPRLTDRLVSELISMDADYVGPGAGVPCFHDGVDPMSRRILDRLSREAGDAPLAREHVTGYLKAHPDFGRFCAVGIEPVLQVNGPRLSVDTPEDLAFFEGLYRHYGAAPAMLDLRQVAQDYARGRALLRREPQIA